MSTSAWGVDHGSEVSKNEKSRKHLQTSAALGATLGGPGAAVHAGVKAKKGRKAAAAAVSGGAGLAGTMLGGAIGSVVSRGNPYGRLTGASVGGALGAWGGAVNNVQHGRIKGLRAIKYPASK